MWSVCVWQEEKSKCCIWAYKCKDRFCIEIENVVYEKYWMYLC